MHTIKNCSNLRTLKGCANFRTIVPTRNERRVARPFPPRRKGDAASTGKTMNHHFNKRIQI
jgi:hypothetical protein